MTGINQDGNGFLGKIACLQAAFNSPAISCTQIVCMAE